MAKGRLLPSADPQPPRYEYFGRKLREGMRRYNVKVWEICETLGVNRESVRLWRQGRNMPRDEKLKKLAGMVGMTPAEMRYEPGRIPTLPALKGEHVTDEDELALLRAYRGLKGLEWAQRQLRMRAVELLEEFGKPGPNNPLPTPSNTQ